MHILLPPSEGKTPPSTGTPLDFDSLAWPGLNTVRRQVADELIDVSASDDALALLGVGSKIATEVEAQRELFDMPCAPAREVYTGVLYEAAQLRPGDDVVIFSGLFGATTGEDKIPAYRLSMGVKLPVLGSVASLWRRTFAASTEFLNDDAVVDMRSGVYQVWKPRGPWWQVKVRDTDGKVISHMAKFYRGLLTRALLDSGSDEVADVARSVEHVTDLHMTQVKNQRTLELVVE
ncbi:peroxide stress protein YaaA [Arcanobacterium haemolyticum]|nr:peroxide stress protein YaaA [Arcanobacterium haemolyticum]